MEENLEQMLNDNQEQNPEGDNQPTGNIPPTGNNQPGEDNQPGGDNQSIGNNPPKIEISIKRHQQLFELLNDPNKLWRVLASLFLIIIILFIGLAFVVISIKKFYPYNLIETNIQGASIVKSEDKDVIYWLFNTADLWANSGIEVQEGDVLTIRASGSSFTAIHHLVDASNINSYPIDKWVGTEGQQNKDYPRDNLRMQYRLCKDAPEGILLMKIINPDSAHKELKAWGPEMLTKDIEVIGKERTLYVSKPGIVHFAVNDIVLIDSVLNLMYKDYIESIKDLPEEGKKLSEETIELLTTRFNNIQVIKEDSSINKKRIDSIFDINNLHFHNSVSTTEGPLIKKAKLTGLSLGRYPEFKNDSSYYFMAYPLINELVYYKQYKFIDAWYMDNLGSFLIVIERKRK